MMLLGYCMRTLHCGLCTPYRQYRGRLSQPPRQPPRRVCATDEAEMGGAFLIAKSEEEYHTPSTGNILPRPRQSSPAGAWGSYAVAHGL
jgi:hypothetical protein